MSPLRYVLASRSPRRRELLGLVVPVERIDVRPPASSDEPPFVGRLTWPQVRRQLQAIAASKAEQVWSALLGERGDVSPPGDCSSPAVPIAADTLDPPLARQTLVIAADTTVLVPTRPAVGSVAALGPGGGETFVVHGQPAEGPEGVDEVRRWFLDDYAGRTHYVATALDVSAGRGRWWRSVTVSAVTMRTDVVRWLDAYLASGEPRGKAGGYALQGLGSQFVTRVDGSLSNVVGLPLETLQSALAWHRDACESPPRA
jgi:septum formation protein